MPRISERSRRISDSAGSLMRLKKHLMLLTACKVSKTLINATFKAYALQYINYVKLVNNRYLEPRGKNRVYKGRSVFMRHLHDKVGEKEHMNEKEFLRTYRMNRRNFNKMVDELKDHHNFINSKKTAKENKEKLEEHLLHFLNFVGTRFNRPLKLKISGFCKNLSGGSQLFGKKWTV